MHREAMWMSHEERWRVVTNTSKYLVFWSLLKKIRKSLNIHIHKTQGEKKSAVSQTWRRLEHSTTSEKKNVLCLIIKARVGGIFVLYYRDNFKRTCSTHCCLNPFLWECYLAWFPHPGSQEEPRGEQKPFSHRQVLGWSHLNCSAISKASRIRNLVKSIFFCPSARVDICPQVPAVVCPLTLFS